MSEWYHGGRGGYHCGNLSAFIIEYEDDLIHEIRHYNYQIILYKTIRIEINTTENNGKFFSEEEIMGKVRTTLLNRIKTKDHE